MNMKEQFPFQSVGVFRFNPKRPGLKKQAKTFQLVLNVDDGIRHYYYNWLIRKYGVKANISELAYTTHITVIKGNELLKDFKESLDYLKKLDGKKVIFHYSPEIHTVHYKDVDTQKDRAFYTLPVFAEEFIDIRKQVVSEQNVYGVDYPFHITIARTL